HLEVGYAVNKAESSPGQEPMPPHYQEPGVGGCGDGDGSWNPPQPDCGARDYLGIATMVVNEGTMRVLADKPLDEQPWKDCGAGLDFADPLAPPSTMQACTAAKPAGGEVPSADTVFNTSERFEITGSLSCARDGKGSLSRFTFDWTLTFCRVVDGKPS